MLKTEKPIHVVGAGLVGSLLAVFLGRRGLAVEVYEKRPDLRQERGMAGDSGRSINLAISTRGLHALRQLGLEDEVLRLSIPMRGRMMHSRGSELTFQPYGLDDSQCINSVSRSGLNRVLLTAAERAGSVRLHFNRMIEKLEFPHDEIVIGTDGSASLLRQELMKTPGAQASEETLGHGYKELTIPAGAVGKHRMERNALHIWPRGAFMLIALPNLDGSFTCTLFLPFTGPVSFEALRGHSEVRAFFDREFPDAAELIPGLEDAFFSNPTGKMVTVKCAPWNQGGRVLLMGDAAHAIVPFFGQGMNCGFEDCVALDELLLRHVDWAAAFSEFASARKPNSDAIADMAVENFIEMSDRVGDAHFLLEKAVEKILEREFPGEYVSRYTLVSFSRTPYRLAFEIGVIQKKMLAELCRGLEAAESVDLARAGVLIRERLAPLMKAAVRG